MASTDIKILEARLLTRDSAVTGSTVTKCATRMQQLFDVVRGGKKADEQEATVIAAVAEEAFSRDLIMYKVEMGKFEQSFKMLDQEAKEYECLEADIESKIEETTQSIGSLTQELVQQKKLKQHRDECEALSRIVNLVPSTRNILSASDVVREEISRLQEQLSARESVENLRCRQVNLLLQSIADLTQSLEEEEALHKQLLTLRQSVENQTQDDDEANDDNDDEDAEEESRDKRSERGKGKRKKPSGEEEGEGDELEVGRTVGENMADEEGQEEEAAAKKKKITGERTGDTESKTTSPGASISNPVVMTIKEKLQQQQAKRAQKKLEKEQREREQGGTALSGETEEGEEEEGSMDTTA